MMAASCDNSEKTESTAFNSLLQLILSDSVPTISVTELSRICEEVTILDTREAEEYNVSRIPGSVHAGFDEFDITKMDQTPKNTPIVVYCSVGYRSEKIGEKLKNAGFQNVRNLYGGIFEWVNQQQTVVNDDGPTNKIHPYGIFWSTWINSDKITTAYADDR
jgi:rhodanese-related sulfurtransferase